MTKWRIGPGRGALLLVGLAFLLTGAQCVPEEKITWSPEGNWAAVRAGDGLRLCNAQGKLSDPLPGHWSEVAWAPDSKSLVAGYERPVKDWSEAAGLLSPATVKDLEEHGEEARKQILLHEGTLEGYTPPAVEDLEDGEVLLVLLYLRSLNDATLNEKLETAKVDLKKIEGSVWQLEHVDVQDGQFGHRRVLVRLPKTIGKPAISPQSAAVTYTTAMRGGGSTQETYVIALDEGAKPRLVAQRTGTQCQWRPDGQAVAFAVASGSGVTPKDEEVRLGAIASRQIAAADGKLLEKFGDIQYAAGILFQQHTRLHYLPDGRLLFAALEVTLPSTTEDLPQQATLFTLDPHYRAVVQRIVPHQAETQLPDSVPFFAASPDGRWAAVPGSSGRLALLDLHTGTVHELIEEAERGDLLMIPAWRNNTQLCFTIMPPKANHAELVLLTLNEQGKVTHRTVLSKGWPQSAMDGLLWTKASTSQSGQ